MVINRLVWKNLLTSIGRRDKSTGQGPPPASSLSSLALDPSPQRSRSTHSCLCATQTERGDGAPVRSRSGRGGPPQGLALTSWWLLTPRRDHRQEQEGGGGLFFLSRIQDNILEGVLGDPRFHTWDSKKGGHIDSQTNARALRGQGPPCPSDTRRYIMPSISAQTASQNWGSDLSLGFMEPECVFLGGLGHAPPFISWHIPPLSFPRVQEAVSPPPSPAPTFLNRLRTTVDPMPPSEFWIWCVYLR